MAFVTLSRVSPTGKCLVVLLGQKKAVVIAVKNVASRRRWSKLREWLSPIWRFGPIAKAC
jgi:hypothetical protein